MQTMLHRNNFDLLRFVFAFVVFLVHAWALSGAETLKVLTDVLSTEVAVKAFFVVSGFLIFMSYEKSRSVGSYFNKRLRRIYPAYASVILIWALLGSGLSSLPIQQYFSVDVLKYLAANLVFLNFLHPNLPGLFETNHLQAVNGALWTLKIEVMFYLSVPLLVWACRRWGYMLVLLLIYVLSIAYTYTMFAVAEQTGNGLYFELQRQLPGQLAFFVIGALGYYYLNYCYQYRWISLAVAGSAWVLQSILPWPIIQPLALGFLVVFAACLIPMLGNFGKYGDFSYGIYIVHFPILQTMIAYGYFQQNPWRDLLLAGILVLLMAYGFWHGIEKPFLRRSSHYVAANQEQS